VAPRRADGSIHRATPRFTRGSAADSSQM
jgi:hypothetical protein